MPPGPARPATQKSRLIVCVVNPVCVGIIISV